jgi:hypothetical protein
MSVLKPHLLIWMIPSIHHSQVVRIGKPWPCALVPAGLPTVMATQAMAARLTSTLMHRIADHAPRQRHLSPMQLLLV